jgi:anaerobic magnesium-protoporphyrin IX monomethyl ester cyclase
MKVLFLLNDQELIMEPLSVMHLAATLKQAGHEVQVLNGEAEGDGLVEAVRAANADLIGFSSTTGCHKIHLAMARRIRAEIDVPMIMGQAHPTFFPEVLENEDCLDFICRGEGDIAIVELADALEGRGDPTAILNIDAKVNGQIIRNDPRPFNENLDDLPFPDRACTHGLMPGNEIERVAYFITGRGCPYNCTYCFNHLARGLAKGKYVRRRSVGNVIRELIEVKESFHPRLINFQDDMFVLDKKWIREFAERYPKEIGLPYMCHLRPNLVNEEIVRFLAESGCVFVAIGLEAGNDRQRNEVLKRKLSREQILNAARILKDHGIHVLTQNLVGIPFETVGTFWDTLEMNRACQPEYTHINIFQPFPRQELTKTAIEAGLFGGDFEVLPPTLWERVSLDLPDARELEHMVRFGNLIIDSALVRRITRLLCILPRNNRLKLRAMRWLTEHEDGIRWRLKCRDSRWRDLSPYLAPMPECGD